jgi:peptide-methionine (S)-S-oxide reductase
MCLRFVTFVLAALGAGCLPAAAAPATALFAGGNFHELQAPFDGLSGVTSTVLGYTGQDIETLQVNFDDTQISYETLLTTFWRNIDPFEADGQFCNRGSPFKAVIYTADAAERVAAEASLAGHQHRFSKPVAVTIEDRPAFRPAEAWHQQYYLKNPSKYRFYRLSCGREARLREIWGGDAPQ